MMTLYLIQTGNYLKIGLTSNLTKRLKQYKTHNPDVRLLDIREGTYADEYFLHKLFEKYLINDSEWMVYKECIISTFKTIKLNHKETISKTKSKKRMDHVKEVIKKRKQWKEANTVFITKNRVRHTYN